MKRYLILTGCALLLLVLFLCLATQVQPIESLHAQQTAQYGEILFEQQLTAVAETRMP